MHNLSQTEKPEGSQPTKDWHNLSGEGVIKILESDAEKGLNAKEVETRQQRFGKNKLPEERPLSRLRIFFEQFRSPLIYILVIAGIITLIFKRLYRCHCYFWRSFFEYDSWFFSRK